MDSPRPASRFGPFFWFCLFVVVVILLALGRAAFAQTPTLPQKQVDTTFQPPANVVSVPAGASLQAAINAAAPGTTLLLAAGATYQPITLPNKAGSGWIYLMTNSPTLPVSGNRVLPIDAPKLAKIACPSTICVSVAAGAHHYRLVGIEASVTGNLGNAAINLWSTSGGDPHHIIVDRSYIHGTASNTLRRGVTLNGSDLAVVDSYIADVHEVGADSQAVWNSWGTGPLKVDNNYLSAAGENFMCGGDDPAPGTIGAFDITITRNHLFKPTAWQSTSFVVKNLLELKNCRRVLIEGNVLQNNWASSTGQNGMAVLFTPRNQGGGCTGCGIQDITFRLNKLIEVQQGINILGTDNEAPSTRTARLLIQNNSLAVCCVQGSDGKGFQTLAGPVDVQFLNNTWSTVGTQSFHEDTPKATGFVFRNNVIPDGAYGLLGTNTPSPLLTLNGQFASPIWTGNALVNASASAYGSFATGNTFPTSVANPPAGVGVDAVALAKAIACTVSGQCADVVPPPNPVDTTPPVVTLTVPQSGQVLLQGSTLTFQATATDSQSSVGPITFQVDGVQSSSTYTFTQLGSHTVSARAVDSAGNVGTTSAAVTVNAPPPVPTDPLPCLQGPWSLSSLTQTATGFTATFTRATTQNPQPGGAACGPSSQSFTTVVR